MRNNIYQILSGDADIILRQNIIGKKFMVR